MKIYHFCREKDARGIKTDGITKGAIPSIRITKDPKGREKQELVIYQGWQWLTLDGDHDGQSWATRQVFKDDRTEYRFTLEIPEKELDSLYDKERILTVYPEVWPLFDGWPGSENWRIFRGGIPKYWIKTIEQWKDGEWHLMQRR